MMPLAEVACAVLMTWNSLAIQRVVQDDTVTVRDSTKSVPQLTFALDTVRKPRAKAIEYSDWYGKRLTLHRRMSWTMLPLFAVSYISGDQLLKASKDGTTAPSWARQVHGPAATGAAVLFGANMVTGSWNLYESRGDSNGRTRRILHSVMFYAASGGFVYAGTKLANDAEQSASKRQEHKNVALYSMGLSTASWLLMLLGN